MLWRTRETLKFLIIPKTSYFDTLEVFLKGASQIYLQMCLSNFDIHPIIIVVCAYSVVPCRNALTLFLAHLQIEEKGMTTKEWRKPKMEW